MKFTEAQLRCFLSDTPFYHDQNCYCLGKSMSEAGNIINEVVNNERKETNDVGMDSAKSMQSV